MKVISSITLNQFKIRKITSIKTRWYFRIILIKIFRNLFELFKHSKSFKVLNFIYIFLYQHKKRWLELQNLNDIFVKLSLNRTFQVLKKSSKQLVHFFPTIKKFTIIKKHMSQYFLGVANIQTHIFNKPPIFPISWFLNPCKLLDIFKNLIPIFSLYS